MECGKGKGNAHPRTDHDAPDEELRYSCTLPLTSGVDVVGGTRHAPATLPPGKTRYPSYRRLGGSQVRSGRVHKISPPTGIRSRNRPSRSESQYRLKYTWSTVKRFVMPFKKVTDFLWVQPSLQHEEYGGWGIDFLGLGLGLGVKGAACFRLLLSLRITGFFHLHVAWKTTLNPVRISRVLLLWVG